MTIHARIVTVIITAAAVIIFSGLAVGAGFLTRYMSSAIEKDMMVVVDIADKYVAAEIALLKIKAFEAAGKISPFHTKETKDDLADALERIRADYPMFTGLAVFDGATLLDAGGGPPVPPGLPDKPFMNIARAGGQAMSTTMHSPDGTLVMYVSAPMKDGLVLIAALPGQYFSDLLSRFTVFETGHLFIDDADGHIIVNIRPEWVQNRVNFIELAKEDSAYKELAAMAARGVAGEQGTARFSVAGESRICAFRPLSSRAEGWFVGIVAPLAESPMKEIPGGMFLIGVITLALSVLAALLASRFLKRPYEEMERLREAAVSASNAKSAFLATVSHEMRTPMNAILGFSELLLTEMKLNRRCVGECRDQLGKLHNAGLTLMSIINDILDLSKIESGTFAIAPTVYDLPSLINDAATVNATRIGDKPIRFVLDIDESLPAQLKGDDLRVRQICNNLLSNAFKYTQEGEVVWRIACRKDDDGESVWMTIRVRDSGIGIREEDIGKLFSDYTQVNAGSTRSIEGTGLGLAVTKRLAEMMDGSVDVESEYGKGSAFTVRIRQRHVADTPIGPGVAEALRNRRYNDDKFLTFASVNHARLPNATILLVDDLRVNLEIAKGLMKPYGMRIDCVTSGAAAIEAVRREETRYSAIFMDHMMPGMDGVEATRIIREEIGTEYARSVPIIMLTANAIVGNEERFLSQGFQAFLSKPIDRRRLDQVVRQWIRKKSREEERLRVDETARPPAGGQRGAENGDSLLAGLAIGDIDWRKALERFNGDEAILVDVLRSYAAHTRPLAASLEEYLNAENLADYAIAVHGIKGASYGIFAQKVGAAAEQLEAAAKRGDLDAIKAGRPEFAKLVETLLNAIDAALVDIDVAAGKPAASEPAPALLRELREACAAFDMDRVDAAMEKLESFRYENGETLIAWLRAQVDNMAFEAISGGEWPWPRPPLVAAGGKETGDRR